MKKQCTVVMYHYVRELPQTRYPQIKGILVSEFKAQLDYLSRYYEFVTAADCLNAVYHGGDLPANALLLTFDDAYIDHFVSVFPILKERGLRACFFPPVKAVVAQEVLDVNKIHFILASAKDAHVLVEDVYSLLDEYRHRYGLANNEYYSRKLAQPDRFDSQEIIFVKRLLQRELNPEPRAKITAELFKKYVTEDEASFARELYLNAEQLKAMHNDGMEIGAHGNNHLWLDTLSAQEQSAEVDASLKFLKSFGVSTDSWTMCYPYGAYNNSLIEILKKRRCRLAFTTQENIAVLTKGNALTLARLDTNDFPKTTKAVANRWVQKALENSSGTMASAEK